MFPPGRLCASQTREVLNATTTNAGTTFVEQCCPTPESSVAARPQSSQRTSSSGELSAAADHGDGQPGEASIAAAKDFAGQQCFFGVPNSDPHHPDVFGISQVGTIYTIGSKIAEHGGDNPGDRDVPLVVYAPGTVPHSKVQAWVETTQVAPTILHLLGLNPHALKAVREEGTTVLPGIG